MKNEGSREREVSAGIVVFDGDRVLVIRNRFHEWVLPKGKIEPGETPEEAALREVEEETGVKAEILGPVGRSQYTYLSDGSGEPVDKTVHWFLGTAKREQAESGIPVRPQEAEGIDRAAFVPRERASALLKYDGELVEAAASLLSQYGGQAMSLRIQGGHMQGGSHV